MVFNTNKKPATKKRTNLTHGYTAGKSKLAKFIVDLRSDVRLLKRRTRNSSTTFQMKYEDIGQMTVTGIPYVYSLSDFNRMRPIFQARQDNGTMNPYLLACNKVKALTSTINYSINIADATAYMFTVSIFVVTLKKTAKLMIDSGISGVFNGSDMVTEKDYIVTPGPLTSNRAQLVLLNKNLFKIHYSRRHVLGRRISSIPPVGAGTATLVTNREDTTIDKTFKFIHNRIYKAAYGNGWFENAATELIQPIAGRPYIIFIVSKIDSTGQSGGPTMALQQLVTLKTLT